MTALPDQFPVCIFMDAAVYFYHLRWAFRSRVLSLIQFVPALHQFNNDRPAEVHQLETSHIGSAMHEPFQRYVLKALRRRKKDGKMRDAASTEKHPRPVTGDGI